MRKAMETLKQDAAEPKKAISEQGERIMELEDEVKSLKEKEPKVEKLEDAKSLKETTMASSSPTSSIVLIGEFARRWRGALFVASLLPKCLILAKLDSGDGRVEAAGYAF
ncbi:hypothetical protein TrLO_g12974 [Triparma laevis f. longispina]|uniref:Uncharacterized protein n=1 Tax=Triparma laevis f. longispina TaxID=1714387 RepID=A0A9W7KUV9_9STRA|nr:hypothetical protein TrLO_g12974 [Triparma laevis f. longispina]